MGPADHGAIRVTVWGENVHEKRDAPVRELYPDGMHVTIAEAVTEHLADAVEVRTATLDQPEHGLTEKVLAETDVLTWWGHIAHGEVADEIVERVKSRVLQGMGLVVLHSGHWSKIFRSLMGTSCNLRWRSDGEQELVWTVNAAHPITAGVPPVFKIPAQEMYGEYFDIPQPDELVFISSFAGGEVFRSGCCFHRGAGRVFYFSPGDQEYPVYHHPVVRKVIANGVRWAYRDGGPLPEPYRLANMPAGWIDEFVAGTGGGGGE
ncbi:MAG TPA: ThuA domain-containing protein [Trebonia sp.]|jgi:trehalose utilization protein|nr:ThuA domain-containing protein [Trebonia sp.]